MGFFSSFSMMVLASFGSKDLTSFCSLRSSWMNSDGRMSGLGESIWPSFSYGGPRPCDVSKTQLRDLRLGRSVPDVFLDNLSYFLQFFQHVKQCINGQHGCRVA